MTYRVNRAIGFGRWGVTNPWVFANYGQPQRQRGRVSPMVFQTTGPFLQSAHLGSYSLGAYESATEAERELLRQADEDRRRSERMERIAWAGLGFSAFSLWLSWQFLRARKSTPNRKRGRRVRRGR